jgi:uncharacterized protein YjbJ (UPF0337 family)
LKGRIRQKWGQLTDNDIAQFGGNVDELIGTIQQKTGEGREAVESFLQQLSDSAAIVFGQTAEATRQYANQAADQACEGLAEVKCWVRKCPCRTLAVGFGLGILSGLLIFLRRRSK